MNCFNVFKTKEKHNLPEKVCQNNKYCKVVRPKEENDIKCNHDQN